MEMNYEEACSDSHLDSFVDELSEELEGMDYGEALQAYEAFKAQPRKGFDEWWDTLCLGLVLTDFELDKEIPDHFDRAAIEAVYLDRLKSPKEKLRYELGKDLPDDKEESNRGQSKV